MSRLLDLVRDSKLETVFCDGYTKHSDFSPGSDSASQRRGLVREECWQRQNAIGRGSFSSVWLEHCVAGKRKGCLRALKCIPKPEKEVDYIRELEAIAKFSHPNYVRCFVRSYGWFESSGDICIAMEYLPLGDLSNYLRSAPSMPEVDTQQIVFQVLEGLALMHDNQFAHRDLKPGNILIQSMPPNEWWVKIADFGITKRAEEASFAPSTVRGTPGYMAPELLGFLKPTDHSSPSSALDIWSLGEIAYRMLTKQAAFPTPYDLFQFVERQESFPQSRLQERSVSEASIDFIQCCMKLEPRARLSSVEGLHHAWIQPLAFLDAMSSPTQASGFVLSDISPPALNKSTEPTAVQRRLQGTQEQSSAVSHHSSVMSFREKDRNTAPVDGYSTVHYNDFSSGEQPLSWNTLYRNEDSNSVSSTVVSAVDPARRVQTLDVRNVETKERLLEIPAFSWPLKKTMLFCNDTFIPSKDKFSPCLSPDGVFIATYIYFPWISIRNTTTGKYYLNKTLPEAMKTVGFSSKYLAFSWNNDLMAVWVRNEKMARQKQTCVLLNLTKGTRTDLPLRTNLPLSEDVSGCLFSKDGRMLAGFCQTRQCWQFWDTRTGTRISTTIKGNPGDTILFDHRDLFVQEDHNIREVRVYDLSTGRCIKEFAWGWGLDRIHAYALAPNGRWLLANSSHSDTWILSDLEVGPPVSRQFPGRIQSSCFSFDSSLLATAYLKSHDSSIYFVDVREVHTGKIIFAFSRKCPLQTVQFLADGKLVVAGTSQKKYWRYHVEGNYGVLGIYNEEDGSFRPDDARHSLFRAFWTT